jgi:hypothetical protein
LEVAEVVEAVVVSTLPWLAVGAADSAKAGIAPGQTVVAVNHILNPVGMQEPEATVEIGVKSERLAHREMSPNTAKLIPVVPVVLPVKRLL